VAAVSSDLTSWLRAQLDEDEQLAREASPSPWTFHEQSGRGEVWADITAADGSAVCDTESGALGPPLETARHLFRWQPARILAEVEAKRRILDWLDAAEDWMFDKAYGGQPDGDNVRKLLALPYADRPGYDETWRP